MEMPMATTNPEKYTYRVMWSEEDEAHVGLCAEFPSLSWLAETQGDALNGITKLVADVLKDLARNKEPIPEPLSVRKFKGHIALRVPPEQHRELAMEAAEQGVSLNRLISKKLGG
jgi:predicted HicB family RNase H-like nuclease